MAFYVRIGCVRFARYCGKMYSRHLFPYGGLATLPKLSYRTIPYHTIPYHTIPYHTIPYHTIPYHTILLE